MSVNIPIEILPKFIPQLQGFALSHPTNYDEVIFEDGSFDRYYVSTPHFNANISMSLILNDVEIDVFLTWFFNELNNGADGFNFDINRAAGINGTTARFNLSRNVRIEPILMRKEFRVSFSLNTKEDTAIPEPPTDVYSYDDLTAILGALRRANTSVQNLNNTIAKF